MFFLVSIIVQSFILVSYILLNFHCSLHLSVLVCFVLDFSIIHFLFFAFSFYSLFSILFVSFYFPLLLYFYSFHASFFYSSFFYSSFFSFSGDVVRILEISQLKVFHYAATYSPPHMSKRTNLVLCLYFLCLAIFGVCGFFHFFLVVADIPRLMREHYAVQRRHKKSNHSACVSAHVHQPRIAKRILVAHLPSSKTVCSMPFASPVCSINFAQSMSEGHMVQHWRQSL